MTLKSNDHQQLVAQTTFESATLTFDFPGLRIGVAEYAARPTGCTVFHFPGGARTAVDVRGGSVGIIGNHAFNDAICFAGSSLYGLEAATGVAAELPAQADYSVNFEHIAVVSGAIIFDFPARDNAIYTDKALGRAALRAAQPGVFRQGRHGAGCSATVGNGFAFNQGEHSGQGGGFRRLGVTKVDGDVLDAEQVTI